MHVDNSSTGRWRRWRRELNPRRARSPGRGFVTLHGEFDLQLVSLGVSRTHSSGRARRAPREAGSEQVKSKY
jgi:hypothetical protein